MSHKVNPGRIRLGNMPYKSLDGAICFFFTSHIYPGVSLKPVGPVGSCHAKAIKKYLSEKLQPRGRHGSLSVRNCMEIRIYL